MTASPIVRVTDDTEPTCLRDLLEARCRRLMTRRAALPINWQTRAERADLGQQIEDTLDEWLSLR